MSPVDPPTCTFATTTGATNIFTSFAVASESSTTDTGSDATASQGESLATFLGASRNAHGSIFFGRYGYVDTAAGIQIFAFSPALDVLAKD